MLLWISFNSLLAFSTYSLKLILAGQTYEHIPQPIHLLTLSLFNSSILLILSFTKTGYIFAGQFSIHLPHLKHFRVFSSFECDKAIKEVKAGKIEYRLDKTNIIHCPIGKASFGTEKLLEKFLDFIEIF